MAVAKVFMMENRQEQGNEELDLLELFSFVYTNKKMIIFITALVTLVCIIYALTAKEIYRSTVTILSVSSGSNSSANIGSSLLSGIGLGISGDSSESQKLVILLQSRTLAFRVVEKIKSDLMPELYPDIWDSIKNDWKVSEADRPSSTAIANNLKSMLKVKKDETSPLLVVHFDLGNAKLAQKFLGTYLDELYIYLNEIELYKSQRELKYIQKQLNKSNRNLLKQGAFVTQYFAGRQVSDKKFINEINTIMNVKSLVDDKEIPPSVYLKYIANKQEALTMVNGQLENSFQQTKLMVEREKLGFQIIDEPDLPLMRISPNRKRIVISGFVMGFLMAVFIVVIRLWIQKLKQTKNAVKTL